MTSAPPAPTAVLIAGPNGAGKTTFARQFVPVLHPGVPFLNADELQQQHSERLGTSAAAARELLARLDAAERAAESFAVETTLSSRSYLTLASALDPARFHDGSPLH